MRYFLGILICLCLIGCKKVPVTLPTGEVIILDSIVEFNVKYAVIWDTKGRLWVVDWKRGKCWIIKETKSKAIGPVSSEDTDLREFIAPGQINPQPL